MLPTSDSSTPTTNAPLRVNSENDSSNQSNRIEFDFSTSKPLDVKDYIIPLETLKPHTPLTVAASELNSLQPTSSSFIPHPAIAESIPDILYAFEDKSSSAIPITNDIHLNIAIPRDENEQSEQQANQSSEICNVPYQQLAPDIKSSKNASLSSPSSSASLQTPPPPYSPPVLNVYSMSMHQSQQNAGASIITQVSAEPHSGFLDPGLGQGLDMGGNIKLDLRGTIIELTRPELSQLPESILLGISNGLCTDNMGNTIFSPNEAEVATVNFSPDCLQYTLDVFREASKEVLPQSPTSSTEPFATSSPTESVTGEPAISELLRTKPAIIVLREDLDYYCLPPTNNITPTEMVALKKECGKGLVEHNKIFTGLQRGEHSGSAEQHLIDMLCSSGFSTDERWGFRSLEPNKTVISSLALVRLKPVDDESATDPAQNPDYSPEAQKGDDVFTALSPISTEVTTTSAPETNDDIGFSSPHDQYALDDGSTVEHQSVEAPKTHLDEETMSQVTATVSASETASTSYEEQPQKPDTDALNEGISGDITQQYAESDISRSHKLLLFWRKPARKCWWDSVILNDIPNVAGPVKVHIRSVWTLELSVIEQ